MRRWVQPVTALYVAIIVGCSNDTSSDRSDQAADPTRPSLQLNDGDVLGNGDRIVRIPVANIANAGVTTVTATLVQQGKIAACDGLIDLTIASESILEACLADQPICAVEFIPSVDAITAYPPPLYAPIGLEYELALIDRNGTMSDPLNAVFCFDVGINTPPAPDTDTYQLIYPGVIETDGVIYDTRCEKQSGSEGLLFNDDDDEHVTNTCLQAELVDLPQFATNLATFENTFTRSGGFRYEGLTNPPDRDWFSYRVSDGVNPPSEPIRVDIVYAIENRPPIAVDDDFTLAEDADPQLLDILENDSDPEGLPLTVTVVNNGPVHGIATIKNAAMIEYLPNPDFHGTDSFDYVVSDSAQVTATATARIQVVAVNDPPVAADDAAATEVNVPVSVNVLANDADPEGDIISVSNVTDPLNGTATVQRDGQIQYTPALNFTGRDTFVYRISDGRGGSADATVNLVVNASNPGNQSPVAINDTITTSIGNRIRFIPIDNDFDPDNDNIRVISVSQPLNGTTVLNGNSNRIVYTPNPEFTGIDTFQYTIEDSEGAVATATVSVTVNPD